MILKLSRRAAVLAATSVLALGLVKAEIVDEIVAKVNDDIVTKSDLDSEEQGLLQELYRRYSGKELDAKVAEAKKELLRHLIDRRVLTQRAGHLFDVTKMQDFYLEHFKEQQNIKSDKDLEKLLVQQGMTMADLKARLVESFAPEQVIRSEVSERIAVSEKDLHAYYDAHAPDFTVPAQATVREVVVKAGDADRDAKRQQAEAIHARLVAPGADFAAIAAEVSDAGTKKAGGLLGTVKRGDLSPALDTATFSQPVGEVGPIIDTDYGFHIVKVDARTDDGVKPLADVREDVETKIRSGRFTTEYSNYIKKAWSEATIWISPKYQDRLSPEPEVNQPPPEDVQER